MQINAYRVTRRPARLLQLVLRWTCDHSLV